MLPSRGSKQGLFPWLVLMIIFLSFAPNIFANPSPVDDGGYQVKKKPSVYKIGDGKTYNHAKVKAFYDSNMNPADNAIFWSKIDHRDAAAIGAKVGGETLETALGRQQDPSDKLSMLNGASPESIRDFWLIASQIHAERAVGESKATGHRPEVVAKQPPNTDKKQGVFQKLEEPQMKGKKPGTESPTKDGPVEGINLIPHSPTMEGANPIPKVNRWTKAGGKDSGLQDEAEYTGNLVPGAYHEPGAPHSPKRKRAIDRFLARSLSRRNALSARANAQRVKQLRMVRRSQINRGQW